MYLLKLFPAQHKVNFNIKSFQDAVSYAITACKDTFYWLYGKVVPEQN
jgi:hypothetical protein